MRMIADDDDEATTSGPSKGQATQQPAWMRQLFDRCKEWLGLLPEVCTLPSLTESLNNGLRT